MLTYQDYEKNTEPSKLKAFLLKAINEYKASDRYKWALEGVAYANKKNTAIMSYEKYVYRETGERVRDLFSANHKIVSNFFGRFITQEVQYLLGNGVNFNDDSTKDALGMGFDTQLQKLAKKALIGGVAYGFWNFDHLEIFDATEFVPLWDEETGALKAGIRFWQLANNKPLRVTLYELDGYSEYIKRSGKQLELLTDKQTYIKIARESVADGLEILDGMNYTDFPICVLWGNSARQSELVGIKSQIDAYDFLASGMCNDLDEFNSIYWVINNALGMDEEDIARFRDRVKTTRVVTAEADGASAEPHTIDVPYQSREAYLKKLEDNLYNDAMALNVQNISAGNVTATAINASYEPLNNKCDEFEYCVIEFIQNILKLINIEDYPTFKRSKLVNMAEETNMVLASAQYLDTETILKHLPFLTPDEVEGILDRLVVEEAERYGNDTEDEPEGEPEIE